MKTSFTRIAIAALALLAAAASSSVQAQATINQNKALAGNVIPGDAPGFPITLSVPGSYKLTGNLVVPMFLTGVVVTATGVTLDLNGFSISGPGTCTRDTNTASVTCSGNGGSEGVDFKSGGNTLRNGIIRGFHHGVLFSGADQIENMLVEQNAGTGVIATNNRGARTLVLTVRSQLNGGDGFNLSDSMVQGSTAGSNGRHGFAVMNTVLLDSVSMNNYKIGFNNFTGSKSAMPIGRSVGNFNNGGNFAAPRSLGGNLDDITLF